ncbi:MAG: amidohydrolase family protein [Tannerellaceae bacterium]|jgi:predicted TIM-barrel fold metal-dependent hydrolase|nr:amidohydrolase family protein [Tannerellaceae bacterium]
MKNYLEKNTRLFLVLLFFYALAVPASGQQMTVGERITDGEVPSAQAQWKTRYADIPRVDVHTHVSDPADVANFLKLRDRLSENNGADLAAWITMDSRQGPIDSPAEMFKSSGGRMLSAFADYEPHRGIHHTLKDFEKKKEQGFIGYKLWFGPYYRVLADGEEGIEHIDHPAFKDVLSAAAKTHTPLLSLHIGDPNGPYGNRLKYIADPVFFWRSVRAAENVIAQNPDVTIIVAHMVFLVSQDAQLDYLRYMLSSYPNMYVDMSATYQYFALVNKDNLRDLMIEYSDRLLFGIDSGVMADDRIDYFADRYTSAMAILEDDTPVASPHFRNGAVQGLALPREVLEKLYYKNALKLYPRLKETMAAKGYAVE